MEFREKVVPMQLCMPKIHCRVFEDNNGAIKLDKCQKYRPHTKQINIKYWHFMENVMHNNIEILPINTKDQLLDIFTKLLPKEMFERLRNKVQGIDWTNKYYPHDQTMECEFYEQKGLWRFRIYNILFSLQNRLFSMRDWNIDAARKRRVLNTCLYIERTAPSKLHDALRCLCQETTPWNRLMNVEGFRRILEIFLQMVDQNLVMK